MCFLCLICFLYSIFFALLFILRRCILPLFFPCVYFCEFLILIMTYAVLCRFCYYCLEVLYFCFRNIFLCRVSCACWGHIFYMFPFAPHEQQEATFYYHRQLCLMKQLNISPISFKSGWGAWIIISSLQHHRVINLVPITQRTQISFNPTSTTATNHYSLISGGILHIITLAMCLPCHVGRNAHSVVFNGTVVKCFIASA